MMCEWGGLCNRVIVTNEITRCHARVQLDRIIETTWGPCFTPRSDRVDLAHSYWIKIESASSLRSDDGVTTDMKV